MKLDFIKSCLKNKKILLLSIVLSIIVTLSLVLNISFIENPSPSPIEDTIELEDSIVIAEEDEQINEIGTEDKKEIVEEDLLKNLKEKLHEADSIYREVDILNKKTESNLKKELERQKQIELEIANVVLKINHELAEGSKKKEELLNSELEIKEHERQFNQKNERITAIQNELNKLQKLYDDCVKASWVFGAECYIADKVVNYMYPELDLLKKEIQTLNNQKKEIEEKKRLAKTQLATIESELVILNKKVEGITDKKSSLDKEINSSKSIVENLNNVLFQFKSRLADLKNNIKEFGDEIITTENPKARRIKTMKEEITKIIEEIIEIKKLYNF